MNIFRDQIFNDVARKDHSEELEVDMNVCYKRNIAHFYAHAFNQYTEKEEYY